MTPATSGPAASDDRALLARVAAGERSALEQLYRSHAGWITARLMGRCSDAEIVDLAVQDTFVAVWNKGARSYRGTGEVAAWLWGIAVRRLVDQLRRRRPTPSDQLPTEATASAEQEVMDGGAHGRVAQMFEWLPADLQAVLQATAIDGLTTREAADLLGIPQGTVKTRLMRARRELKEHLV